MQALVSKCGAQRSTTIFAASGNKTCLSPSTATASFREARALGLPGFEAECAAFVGSNAKAVASAPRQGPADPIVVILAEVTRKALQPSSLAQVEKIVAETTRQLYSAQHTYSGCTGSSQCPSCKRACTGAAASALMEQMMKELREL